MANQASLQDPNQIPTLMVASGTTNTAETRRVLVDGFNNLMVSVAGASGTVVNYDNIVATYPSGTTEVYTFQSGTTPVKVTTVNYTDSTKGSISTVTYA